MIRYQQIFVSGTCSLLLASSLPLLAAVTAQETPQPLACEKLATEIKEIVELKGSEKHRQLESVESSIRLGSWTAEEKAGCYKWIADQYRGLGSYQAEVLYMKALDLAPKHPEVLEGIAQYYRNFRGTKGLFAKAEAYYLRAEEAIADALVDSESLDQGTLDYLEGVHEAVVRGRIELNKREGLGLVLPRKPGEGFGLYLSLEADDGEFPISHNDLATPAFTLHNIDPDFDNREIIRQRDLDRRRTRLRFRSGKRPYWDLAWSTTKSSKTITSDWLPVRFFDLEIEEVEIAVENVAAKAPYGELLWRFEFRHGTFDVLDLFKEEFDRFNAFLTFTHNFGRLKTDLEFIGSAASIELPQGETDVDLLGAINLRMVHYHPQTAERKIDPRGYEYNLGYVRREREFGEVVKLIQETVFASVKLRELVRRTDLQLLPNYFSNTIVGKEGEDSANLELNVILTHRLVDLVNNLERRQARQTVGLAQWALNVRLFEDVAISTIDDFESRGYVVGSFVELFSGPANRSTVILEANYEVREYPHLDREEKMLRFALRLGF